jgi:transglutaminase-like putative cysteine protease
MNVKGVDNSKIYDDIISTINGKIYLTDSIKVKITYDTDTETGLDGGNMDISPTDTPGGTVLSIQYPDYYTNPYHEDLDEDINYYLEGDDDFSNGECIDRDSDGSCDSTPNVLVRKYAVEAAAYFGTFPDNPKDVSFNVFRYVDDKLGKDKDPAPYANNDIWIVGEFENKRDLSNIGWICIPQAYLFTSFERALGFPSREITVGEGTHKAESEKPKIEYYQNAGAEVWYNGYWNYYDPWTSEENYNVLKFDDLLGINITASACKI